MAEKTSQLFLDMQLITDRFEEYMEGISLKPGGMRARLRGARLFRQQNALEADYVYIARGRELPEFLVRSGGGSLITVGPPPAFYQRHDYSLLVRFCAIYF